MPPRASQPRKPITWTPFTDVFKGASGYHGRGGRGEVYDILRQTGGGFRLLGVGSYKRSIRTLSALKDLAEASRTGRRSR